MLVDNGTKSYTQSNDCKAHWLKVAVVVAAIASAVMLGLVREGVLDGSFNLIGYSLAFGALAALVAVAVRHYARPKRKIRSEIVQTQQTQSAPRLHAIYSAADASEVQNYQKARARFKQAVADRMQKIVIKEFEFFGDSHVYVLPIAHHFTCLGNKAKQISSKYIQYRSGQRTDTVCFLDQSGGEIVYKRIRDVSPDASGRSYVNLVQLVRERADEHSLHLLHIPKCGVVSNFPEVVAHENANLWSHHSQAQRACYAWITHDDDFKDYCTILLEQLATIICETGFTDVHFGNIPLTKKGRVALIDLDQQEGALNGIRGLLSLIPEKWFETVTNIAKRYQRADYVSLEKMLPEHRQAAQARESNILAIEAFHKKHQITVPTQLLVFNRSLFKDCSPEIYSYAEKIIALINQEITKFAPEVISLIGGRRIEIPNTALESNGKIQDECGKILKDLGYIFSYSREFLNTTFVC